MIAAVVIGAAVSAVVCVGLGWLFGRDIVGYRAGRADGYQEGIAHDERVRAALKAERDALAVERDQMEAALNEFGEMYDAGVARRFAPAFADLGDDALAMVADEGSTT